MLSYERLKERPRDLLGATGLTVQEYEPLLSSFEAAYEKKYPPEQNWQGQARQRSAGAGAVGQLRSAADKLLFILVYHKTHPLQLMHGLSFGLSQSQAPYWIHRLLPVLLQALRDREDAPTREATQVAQSALSGEGGADLLIDGTERRRQRPQDQQRQKEHYSGKKKAHTDKNLVLVNQNSGKVVYLSETVTGKKHDKKMADEAQIAYPQGAILAKDSGFQGYEPEGVFTLQPKKTRGAELSAADKLLNGVLSSSRVKVEHAIAGLKRSRIVKDVLRLTRTDISDQVMEIACGLHNLRVSSRHPLLDLDSIKLRLTPYPR